MSRIGYFIRETLISLRRNVMMTISGIITIAICATIVTGSLLFIRGNDRAARQQRAGVELEIFLKLDSPDGEVQDLKTSLDEAKQQHRIRGYKYLDHNAAFEVFKSLAFVKNAPDLLTATKPADLNESFRIQLQQAKDVETVAQQYQARPGVQQVITPERFIRPYFENVDRMRVAMLAVSISLLIASMFLVVMTVRLATYARRREIEVMKLVGASNLFVRVPFLAEGIVQGLIGGGVAFGLTFAARSLFNDFAAQSGGALIVLKGFELTNGDAVLLGTWGLVGSAVIGMMSAIIGLWRFLDV